MNSEAAKNIYTKNTIEFVTVAKEYCSFVEEAEDLKKKDFLFQSQKLLSLLYLKTSMLEEFESVLDVSNEKFVTEGDWDFIKDKIAVLLGETDVFVQIVEPIMQFDDDEINVSLSEIFADIYQDLRDTIAVFAIGDEDMMNDAVWECKLNFEQYWGQRLVTALSEIHNIIYGAEDLEEKDE